MCRSIPLLPCTLSGLDASLCTTQTLILHFSTSYLVLLFSFLHLMYFIGHLEVDIRPLLSGSLREGSGPPGRMDRLKIFTLNWIG